MAIVIKMPRLSDTMEEGGVASWLKQEGDTVEEGEALVEIETDKATMEYQSPESGQLLRILVTAGQSAALGAPIAVLGAEGEQVDATLLEGASKAEEQTPTQAKTQEKQPTLAEQSTPMQEQVPAQEQEQEQAPIQKQEQVKPKHTGERIKASPLARRLASEQGIKLENVRGSGPQGRIVARDIGTAGVSAAAPTQAPTRVALTQMRKTIAKRLQQAKHDIPHYYLKAAANVGHLLQGRQQLNATLSPEQKISFNDIIAFMTIKALLQHQQVNTAWADGQEIIQHHTVNLALAVALPEGLITPVIENSERLSLTALSAASKALVAKAKRGRLSSDEYRGGTFTISNLGMYGIEEFSAIINPPQAAILAVGAARAVPQVLDDGQLGVQQRVALTLSCDHRLIDGAVGAQFLATLVAYLENPLLLLG